MEVLSEGEWWDAEVTKIKSGQARVHYVGGAEDEDEWIPISRYQQTSPVIVFVKRQVLLSCQQLPLHWFELRTLCRSVGVSRAGWAVVANDLCLIH